MLNSQDCIDERLFKPFTERLEAMYYCYLALMKLPSHTFGLKPIYVLKST